MPRRVLLDTLAADVAPFEAERQLDTAVNWGRWAQLFDYDADDGWFLPAPDNEVAR